MAAAAASLRSFGSRLKGLLAKLMSSGWLLQDQKVKKRSISFVQSKAGLWVLEDVCCKEGRFEKVKEKITQGWENLDERVRGIILENIIRSAVLTVWGAGVFSVTKSLERLGVIDTGLSNAAKQKEQIAAVVKAESQKTLEIMWQQHHEDRAMLNKLSKEFEAHRTLTKLWLSRLIEKTADPLSKQELSKFVEAFSLYDKDGDGMITLDEAKSVLETLGDNISEAQLHKLVAESGKIALPELLRFMVDKVKHAEASKQKEVTPEASSSSS